MRRTRRLDTCFMLTAGALLFGGCYRPGLDECRLERERLFQFVKKHEGEGTAKAVATEPRDADPTPVMWKSHLTFLASERGLDVPQRRDVGQRGVFSERHLVKLGLDGLMLRNVPNVSPGEWVAVGVELTGALPDGRSLHRLLGVTMAKGPTAEIKIREVPMVNFFPYRGRSIQLTFLVQTITPDEAPWLQGQLTKNEKEFWDLDPNNSVVVRTAETIYASTFERFRQKKAWRYAVTWYPGDNAFNEKPELVLMDGKQALITTPPFGTPAPLDVQLSVDAMRGWQIRNGELVRKATNEPYSATPYFILNVKRQARGNASSQLEALPHHELLQRELADPASAHRR